MQNITVEDLLGHLEYIRQHYPHSDKFNEHLLLVDKCLISIVYELKKINARIDEVK